jgi:hypothetical protein
MAGDDELALAHALECLRDLVEGGAAICHEAQ